ncbi:pantetheine-phosphate adenylyltransferase [Bradymonadaceae bacterium TMQ3]|nr:pantetheine-phosphate adenylyltransferase [Bradymonadaceae bacterium TMQ3]TXC75475.1 pantetheine-phosphate adenylyltransferase [Bradymonadales bacterium TMQ1]
MTRVALYAGTFDPPTLGHHSVITRAARLVDRLIVVIAINPLKTPLFSLETRQEMLRELVRATTAPPDASVHRASSTVEVTTTDALVIDLARQIDAETLWLVRGARTPCDFIEECRLADLNRQLCPGLETLILPSPPALSEVSSTRVRELLDQANQGQAHPRPPTHPGCAIDLADTLTDAPSNATLGLHQLCHPSTLRLIERHQRQRHATFSPEPRPDHGP